jgi:uncharacterized protein
MNVMALLLKAFGQVGTTLLHNWPFLLVSILLAAAMKLYLDQASVAGFLRRYEKGGILAATAAAVTTPLCSCGTTAIVLGMMAGSMPWAPIIAFMVASPLTSPEELVYSAGLFGWPFAIAFFAASVVLGLTGGMVGAAFDARGWLRNQARFSGPQPACGCDSAPAPRQTQARLAAPITLMMTANESCGCGTAALPLFASAPEQVLSGGAACGCEAAGVTTGRPASYRAQFEWAPYAREVAVTGRRLLVLFLAFATIGYLINDLVPAAWITSLFGSGHAYSVPLAATLGLPFYINTEASLPLVRGMLNSGMSAGAALAFLITGAGTSIGAVAGAMAIARWRVIGLVIGTLWVGAILCGFAYDALLAAALF